MNWFPQIRWGILLNKLGWRYPFSTGVTSSQLKLAFSITTASAPTERKLVIYVGSLAARHSIGLKRLPVKLTALFTGTGKENWQNNDDGE